MTTTTTEKPLLAFHNDPAIKKKYLARVRKHRKADQLVQGYGYWEDGKGCAVGCTLHGSNHGDYEIELGIPRVLAFLEDGFFENLSVEEARAWPEAFLDAIPVGADLELVWPKFAHWMLVDPELGVIEFATTPATKKAVEDVAALYARWIAGDKPAEDEWLKAEASAASADWAAREKHYSAMSQRLIVILKECSTASL